MSLDNKNLPQINNDLKAKKMFIMLCYKVSSIKANFTFTNNRKEKDSENVFP